jgi:hypothetical protein
MQRVSEKTRSLFRLSICSELPDSLTIPEKLEVCNYILRCGASYGRMMEDDCNYGDEGGKRAKKEERLEKRLTEYLAQFNIVPIFSGDPRGNTLKLKLPSGRTDSFGGDGFCVPTS